MRGAVLLSFFLSVFAHTAEIAYFIKKNPDGTLEVYDERSPYSHVAIRVGEEWLHARPYFGVELTSDPSAMGEIHKIYFDSTIPEPTEEFLGSVLGKKYFLFADWHDPEVFNCTKLVARYLEIPPNPMEFDTAIWDGRFEEFLGKPGLSLAELEDELVVRNYSHKSRCGILLAQ